MVGRKHSIGAQFEIHVSDVRTFKSCRRRWAWSSPLRENLEPNFTPAHFMIGRAVHYATASFLEDGTLPADACLSFLTTEREKLGTLWPDEQAKWDKNALLAMAISETFHHWAAQPDGLMTRWRTLATEMSFRVPLYNEKGQKSPRVFFAGRVDGLFVDEHGEVWLREYKTTSRQPNPDWLTLDLQAAMYCWAMQEATGKRVAGVHYIFLHKKVPQKPDRLKNGGLSRAINSSLNTTAALYREAISDLAMERATAEFARASADQEHREWETSYELIVRGLESEYGDVLRALESRGYEEYVTELKVRKSEAELARASRELYMTALEMTRETTRIYASEDWLKCDFCAFKQPCIAMNRGLNYRGILDADYRKRVNEPVVDSEDQPV